VKKVEMGKGGVPYVVTHDGRTIRYPDPLIEAYDTVKIDLAENKITDIMKFETGNLAMISGGKNTGRVGVIVSREKHPGSFDIVHVKDALGAIFATRLSNVFVIGKGTKPMISLPKRKGLKRTILEERVERPTKN
jgi:small subunit ribosomal protein S4e